MCSRYASFSAPRPYRCNVDDHGTYDGIERFGLGAQMIGKRKYRFKRASDIPAWPLRLMPHTRATMAGQLNRNCVVTAVAKKVSPGRLQPNC